MSTKMASDRPILPAQRRRRHGVIAASIALFVATSLYLTSQLPSLEDGFVSHHDKVVSPGIGHASFEYGLSQCESILEEPSPSIDNISRTNPRATSNSTLLIKNGHLWLGDRYVDGDLLVQDGVIRDIGGDRGDQIQVDKVIDAGGSVVTPGIVDMHSHMLVESFYELNAVVDNNEMTQPTTPFVRVIDAINPGDPALKVVASGGVTTSLILPGSGNLMGGEAAVVKLRPMPTLSGEDMLVTANAPKDELVWRYMKMACGENARRAYGLERHEMPKTRMGEAYLFRKRFQEAHALKRAQDDWCEAAIRLNSTHAGSKGRVRLDEPFPEDLDLESLVALMRHKVKLNVHCYLPQDIEAMVRHSLEFDFDIAAFHHALSAWQVPDIIKRAKTNITIATFGDMWGYKHEGWDTNVEAPSILTEAGIPVALKSDHPVTDARDLMHEAQKAYHYGFSEHDALKAVTSVPAAALGLDYRIGSIEVGKDADLVVWDQHPLTLGARPKHVVIDGMELEFNTSWAKHVDEEIQKPSSTNQHETHVQASDHSLPPKPATSMQVHDTKAACAPDVDTFVLRNISRLHAGPDQTYDGPIELAIKEGRVTCISSNCINDEKAAEFDLNGGVVIPGILLAGAPLGLTEIIAEPATLDGYAKHDLFDKDLHRKMSRAAYGVQFNGLHMQKAFRAGITTSISQPLIDGDYTLAGVSVAFHTGVQDTAYGVSDAYVEREAALHFTISHSATAKLTVSQQIAAIRDVVTRPDPLFLRASNGEIPVVVETDNKDEIASIARLKKEELPQTRFVILGGAEAHLAANALADADIPVILKPGRCYGKSWQARQCLYGPPLTSDSVLDVLLAHGVRVGLGSTDPDDGSARNMIWEAGWNLAHNANLTQEAAVGLVTWNLAHIFGLQDQVGSIQKGHQADFVAYNGNPFEFGTRVQMVYGGAYPGPLCFPKQV